jgi:resolvase-like protein
MKDTRKPEGAVLGYGRVSREGRTWRSSVPCTRLFEEKASGGRWDRPELQRLLDHLRPGDVTVVWKLDRLSRSLKDLLHIIEKIGEAGAGFRSLTEHIDTTTPAGRMMMQMVGASSAPWPLQGQRGRSVDGARSWTIPSAARSPRRSSQVGRPQHRWRGCSVSHHRPCHASSPLSPHVRRSCPDGAAIFGRRSR